MERIRLEGPSSVELRVGRARKPEACLVFMPGRDCRASRYDWLGALADQGICVGIVDAAPGGGVPITNATQGDLLRAVDQMAIDASRIFAAGHSLGAVTILDALEVGALRYNAVAGAAVLGCSLQPRTLRMTFAHRTEAGPLHRQPGLPLLFLSGDHDRVASPELMEATRRRYAPPTQMVLMRNATHYGWADKPASTDRAAFDAPGDVDLADQRVRTLAYLAAWIRGEAIQPVAGDVIRRD